MKDKFQWGGDAKIESDYKYIPERISTRQKNLCENCCYRIYQLQKQIAINEAYKKGGNTKDYVQGFYIMNEAVPKCKRKKCLIDSVYLEGWRGQKSSSLSFNKKVIKYNKIKLDIKEN